MQFFNEIFSWLRGHCKFREVFTHTYMYIHTYIHAYIQYAVSGKKWTPKLGTAIPPTGCDVDMVFRLVLTSVTLNNVERSNSPYFALFHRIR